MGGDTVGHWNRGVCVWEGEESSDLGKIVVTNNVVETKTGTITYE